MIPQSYPKGAYQLSYEEVMLEIVKKANVKECLNEVIASLEERRSNAGDTQIDHDFTPTGNMNDPFGGGDVCVYLFFS